MCAKQTGGGEMTMNERYEKGAQLLKSKRPDEYENLTQGLARTAPDAAKYVIEFAYGDIWSRPNLELKTKALVTISCLASIGGAEPQLKSHIGGALKCGCTETEIIETLYQIIPYAGLPRALNAMKCANDVFKTA